MKVHPVLRALAMPLGFLLGALITLPFALAMRSDVAPATDLSDEPNLGRANAVGSAPWLMEKHDCWTEAGPEGVIPGHVVVLKDDAVAPTYGGARLTGMALEQLFDGKDHGLVVYGFCR